MDTFKVDLNNPFYIHFILNFLRYSRAAIDLLMFGLDIMKADQYQADFLSKIMASQSIDPLVKSCTALGKIKAEIVCHFY